jgi:hypothetical protein
VAPVGFSKSSAGPPAGPLRDLVDDSGDLEVGIDRFGDARELAAAIEFGDEGINVCEHFGYSKLGRA